jgi:hypothetical protein
VILERPFQAAAISIHVERVFYCDLGVGYNGSVSVVAGAPSSPAPAEGLTRVTVLGDEVVSVRPLDPTERWLLDRFTGAQRLRALLRLVGLCLLALAGAALVIWWAQSWVGLPFLILLAKLAGDPIRANVARIRRAKVLRQDQALGQLLVFDSPRGHCERLAGSGWLWQRDGVAAPWREETR